jgi:hypothetical protein
MKRSTAAQRATAQRYGREPDAQRLLPGCKAAPCAGVSRMTPEPRSTIRRLSYDLYLMRFRAGAPAEIDSPEFWELLAHAWEEPPDEHGCVRLVRGDGEADVYAGRPGESPRSVMVNHFSGDEIMDVIVDLARQADAVIIGPDLPPLLTRAEQREQLPPDMDLGEAVLIASGRELSERIAQD